MLGSRGFSYLAIATGFCILQVNVSRQINDFLFTAALWGREFSHVSGEWIRRAWAPSSLWAEEGCFICRCQLLSHAVCVSLRCPLSFVLLHTALLSLVDCHTCHVSSENLESLTGEHGICQLDQATSVAAFRLNLDVCGGVEGEMEWQNLLTKDSWSSLIGGVTDLGRLLGSK